MADDAAPDLDFEAFRDRVDSYCSGEIAPDEFRKLEAELLASGAARSHFVEYFRLHAELGFAARAGRAADAALRAVGAAGGAGPGSKLVPRGGRRRWRARTLVGLAAAGLVGAGLAVIPRGGRMTATPTSARPPAADLRPVNVAWLVNAQDCRWADRDETPGRDMAAGKILRLDRGLAEVEFDRGARVILQAPAALELLSANAARLLRGSMTATVPPSAHGFTVYSPQGKVVDLGTEFGLAVEDGGATAVRVFAGALTAAAGRDARGGEVRLSEGQAARIAGDAVAVAPGPGPAEAAGRFARAIVPPPEIRPRTVRLDFRRPAPGTLRDARGLGVGLARRLAGTGSNLPAADPNLRLRTDIGALELTTTRSDLNQQVGMASGEYLGVALRDLGFTGAEDFAISVELPDIPGLDAAGQFGLYAGTRSDRSIRGGVLRQPNGEGYQLFLVNNDGGVDRDVNEVGLSNAGDDLRFTLRRAAGAYSLTVENRTRRSSNTLTIAPSTQLDGAAELDVGLFGANAQSDVRKTLTIRDVEVTVFTTRPAGEGGVP